MLFFKSMISSFFLIATSVCFGQSNVKFGVSQSDLIWHLNNSKYPSHKMIEDLAQKGVTSLRTNIRQSSSANEFSQLVLKANKNGMSVVAAVLQEPEDYQLPLTDNDYGDRGSNFKNLCGWSGGTLKFSRMNLTLYKNRLKNHLNSLKSAGASVEAFEIGNELDWVCFNGDIKLGEKMHAEDSALLNFSTKYAQVLELSYKLIKEFFPESKVITFGSANCILFSSTSCMVDSPNFLANLKNVSNENVLSKYSDGIAVHIYPLDQYPHPAVQSLIESYKPLLESKKKLWVTESGVQSANDQITGFQRLINVLKSSQAVSHFYAYTFFSYTGEEHFSLSKGLGMEVNPAINLFAEKSSATTCWISMPSCPDHPEWNLAGLFPDYANANNSHNNKAACLNRATDYANACRPKGAVSASFSTVYNNVVIDEKIIAPPPSTSCEISMSSCPSHPEWNLSGTFPDHANANNSNSNQAACLSRASDYLNACNTKDPVTSSFLIDGKVVAQKVVTPNVLVTSCQITLTNCPAHPEWNLSGTFIDYANANNSNNNQNACLARAKDYLDACRPQGNVKASYISNGVSVGSKTVP